MMEMDPFAIRVHTAGGDPVAEFYDRRSGKHLFTLFALIPQTVAQLGFVALLHNKNENPKWVYINANGSAQDKNGHPVEWRGWIMDLAIEAGWEYHHPA